MKYIISSDGFTITIKALTLVAGNKFHIYKDGSDYGLYTVLRAVENAYTTSTRLPALSGLYTISLIESSVLED